MRSVPLGWSDVDAANLVDWFNIYVLPASSLAAVWAAFWK